MKGIKVFLLIFAFAFCFMMSGCSNNTNTTNTHSSLDNNKEYVTITFDSQGGTSIENQRVEKGNAIEKPEEPTKDGFIFEGWYIDDEKWNFYVNVAIQNMTLTAKWSAIFKTEQVDNELFITGLYYSNIEELIIPSTIDGYNVVGIGNRAFYDCDSLTSVTIPNSVTSIGNSAFSGCSSLTSTTILDSVTSIGDYAFLNCTSLACVTLGNSVTNIGDSAFSECSSLTSITIPDSVTSIGSGAFAGCTSLTSITIPNSVTSLGFYAFEGCPSLTIYCEASSKPSGWAGNWSYCKNHSNGTDNCTIVWNYKGN